MNIFSDAPAPADQDWAASENSHAKRRSGRFAAIASAPPSARVEETPSKTLNFNDAKRSPLSPHSHNQQKGANNASNMRKAVLKKQHAASAAADFVAMPPPPPAQLQRRPTRQAPKPPDVVDASSVIREPQPPLNTSKRSAKDERSGQKPTKRRRIDGNMPPPAPVSMAAPIAPSADATAATAMADDESIPMDMDVPSPMPPRAPSTVSASSAAAQPTVDQLQQRAEELKKNGNDKYVQGNYVEARVLYTKASECVQHSSPVYLCNRSACGLMLGEFESALRDALAAISLDRHHARALERAGRASLALGQGKECSKYMNKAIASLRATAATSVSSDAPTTESRVFQLKSEVAKADKFEQSISRAERCVRRHDGSEALKAIAAALEVSPSASNAKLMLAAATVVEGMWSGVVDTTQKAGEDPISKARSIVGDCRSNSISSRACMHSADMLFEGGYIEGAIALLEATQRHSMSPHQSSAVSRRLKQYTDIDSQRRKGLAEYKKHKFDQAHAIFTHLLPALKTRPQLSALVLAHRAAASVGLQNSHAAMDDCNNALKLRPSFLKARVVRARAMLSMGKTEDAIRDLIYCKKAYSCTVIQQELERAQNWHNQKLKQQEKTRKKMEQQRAKQAKADAAKRAAANKEKARSRERERSRKRKEREQRERLRAREMWAEEERKRMAKEAQREMNEKRRRERAQRERSSRASGAGYRRSSRRSSQASAAPKQSNTHYDVLGVSSKSDAKMIKKAYRKLALKFHPDKNKEPGAEDMFKRINAAYTCLKSPGKKRDYDRKQSASSFSYGYRRY